MIDDVRAKEKVDEMNKQNFQNLLAALAVEKYLFDIFGNALDTAYSPDSSTMVVRYKNVRSNGLKNIIESVKTAVHSTPESVKYFGKKEGGKSGARVKFPGGFYVMAMLETGIGKTQITEA